MTQLQPVILDGPALGHLRPRHVVGIDGDELVEGEEGVVLGRRRGGPDRVQALQVAGVDDAQRRGGLGQAGRGKGGGAGEDAHGGWVDDGQSASPSGSWMPECHASGAPEDFSWPPAWIGIFSPREGPDQPGHQGRNMRWIGDHCASGCAGAAGGRCTRRGPGHGPVQRPGFRRLGPRRRRQLAGRGGSSLFADRGNGFLVSRASFTGISTW